MEHTKPSPLVTLRSLYDTGRDWAFFVAGLCFIEFYVEFVRSGDALWTWYQSGPRATPWQSGEALVAGFGLPRALVFYLIGRAVWYRRSATRLVIAAALLSLLVTLAAAARDGRLLTMVLHCSGVEVIARKSIPSVHWLALLLGLLCLRLWPARLLRSLTAPAHCGAGAR